MNRTGRAAVTAGSPQRRDPAAVLRALLLAAWAERDSITSERDTLSAERDSVTSERDSLSAERDALMERIERLQHLEAAEQPQRSRLHLVHG